MTRRLLFAALLLVGGCDQDMIDQPRYEEYEAAPLFPDGMVNQAPPDGTVARGARARAEALTDRPPLSPALLARGQERYEIYCAPCHGLTGHGDGMIVQRGFPPPPSYHIPRLREMPLGYVVQVITHGIGDMYAYATRVAPADRWAIEAYVRTLQLSQGARTARLPTPYVEALHRAAGEAR